MKKLITTFAAVGLIGLAGCAAEDEDVILEDPVFEETTPPVVTEPTLPPLGADTMVIEDADPALDADADLDVDVDAAEPM